MMKKTSFGLPKKREEVIELLQKAYTENDLDENEYEDRLQKSYEAKSIEDLQEVIHDFPNKHLVFPTSSYEHFGKPYTNQDYTPPKFFSFTQNDLANDQGSRKQVTSIFGEQKLNLPESYYTPLNVLTIFGSNHLNCQKTIPKSNLIPFSVKSVLGETKIDLRNPQLHGKTVHVAITNMLGEIKILVPKGISIQNMTNTVLGDYNEKQKNGGSNILKKLYHSLTNEKMKEEEVSDIHFTVVLRGTCLLGNVKVIYY